MSSFNKNIIPRRIHKERVQPAARIAKHGLLEKKQDYKLRSKNQNRKAAHLKLLREKAALRNPDEFYFAMTRRATDDGVVRRVTDKNLIDAIPLKNRSGDQRLLVESQDSRYVAYKLALEKGRVASLEKGLHSISAAQSVPRKHIIFADDDDDADAIVAEKHQNASTASSENVIASHLPKPLRKARKKAYRKLENHTSRCEKLNTVVSDMTVEKNLLSKGRRKLVRPSDKETGAPPVFQWLQERSR